MMKKHLCIPILIVFHLLMAYLLQMITRVVYLLENWSTFSGVFHDNSISQLLTGCWMFDTSAVMYTNCLVVLMMVVLPVKWYKVVTWVFTVINGVVVAMNLGDAVYFKYTGHRTTMSVFGEFEHENNLGSVLGAEIVNHWYLFVLGVVLIVGMWWMSRWLLNTFKKLSDKSNLGSPLAGGMPKAEGWNNETPTVCQLATNCSTPHPSGAPLLGEHLNMNSTSKSKVIFTNIAIRIATLLVFLPCCIAGMRGGWTTAVRPITISNANQYVEHPTEAALVLNTPFALIRTVGKDVFRDPEYFDDKTLATIYTPVHAPSNSPMGEGMNKVNVVVLIVESFGREYIGNYNELLEGGRYKGYAPFIDSLYNESLSFDYTFANGRQSIDGMPSILSGIPRFIEPFFLTPASMNDVSGLAGELGKDGYYSAFFHGAENGSMGFEAFAKHTGYNDYFGRTEYDADKRFGGEKDFDGTWAIWDEPFMQFYALKMSEFKQPFVSTIFTASSHHPYAVPNEYGVMFKDDNNPSVQCGGPNPIHKCITYTDMAIRKFFDTARKQPWYKNTIFVFTSDHTNLYDHEEYGTDLGLFGAPILFYDPSGRMPRGRMHSIAQQTDIMPTVLGWIGYKRPYVAWGVDLLNTPAEETWAVNYTGGGMYQFVKGDYLLQFDGTELKAVYNFRKDWMLKYNLLSQLRSDKTVLEYERQLKAIIQTYMQRMVGNRLIGDR